MKRRIPMLVLAAVAVLPGAAHAADGDEPLLPTRWSLEKPAADQQAGQRERRHGAMKAHTPKRRAKPRIFGSARAGNSSLRSRRAAARVGVAVPF